LVNSSVKKYNVKFCVTRCRVVFYFLSVLGKTLFPAEFSFKIAACDIIFSGIDSTHCTLVVLHA